MKKNLKKDYNRNKITELFKVEIITRKIMPALNWKGARMIFPYTWNGEIRFAVVEFPKIKWDKKRC